MTAFKDHFSGVADVYAASRPTYPDALYDAIAATVPPTARVWEPGCGSGQATRGLAARFAHVHATDPSAAQIQRHWAHDLPDAHVTLAVEVAETTALTDESVDLVAVAQALHWFDRYRFFATCERVLRPGGVLAAWTYQDIVFEDDLADVAEKVRDDIDPYWPPERDDVDMGYGDYVWPFDLLPAPRLWLTAQWNLPTLLGYFTSLSATASYRAATGQDPVYAHTPALAEAWGDPARVRTMRWPLILHLRRKPL
ncbi:class I SAM-dependent methyltransferase [Pseudoxanthomonas sp. SL93]|jgi:SAM-dependent methyltransferase|uniref:class I SAM-dependent methyltransferase n=1 Tax=Pseudoxanthomonas sp. SL93 TaxID=2995142 RepID=UPI002270BF77|nr:class I SAM-dependent methyltransferase [Pseudoxanthomonas sp. SL93]WAC61788.1 class I SAM-dependent methyltransferase [Pseudoxanthomonas sp. SL93]